MDRKSKRALRKGATNRRIIISLIHDGRIYEYHATKGWRSYRRSA